MILNDSQIDTCKRTALAYDLCGVIILKSYYKLLLIQRGGSKKRCLNTFIKPLRTVSLSFNKLIHALGLVSLSFILTVSPGLLSPLYVFPRAKAVGKGNRKSGKRACYCPGKRVEYR